jgi:DNA-binding CsgD family transcriptional regulator
MAGKFPGGEKVKRNRKSPYTLRANPLHHLLLPNGDTYELTERQLQILTRTAQGQSAREVAKALHIGAHDVNNRLQHLADHMGVDRETLLKYGKRIVSARKQQS